VGGIGTFYFELIWILEWSCPASTVGSWGSYRSWPQLVKFPTTILREVEDNRELRASNNGTEDILVIDIPLTLSAEFSFTSSPVDDKVIMHVSFPPRKLTA